MNKQWNSDRVCIGLVLTGGAIGSAEQQGVVSLRSEGMLIVDVTDRGLGDEAHLVARAWTSPRRLDMRVRTPLRKLSESMHPTDWVAIAKSVRELVLLERANAVLVFHGTDTAAYTAAALSFLLHDIEVPVVITGANLPTSDVNSDALANTRDALIAAEQLPAGVYISFAGDPDLSSEVHLGTRVRKIASTGQPFTSPNHGPIARVIDQTYVAETDVPSRGAGPHVSVIHSDAAIIGVYPGIDLRTFAGALIESGARGVVVRLYSGITGPENDDVDSLPAFVKVCTDAGMSVVTAVDHFHNFTMAYPSFAASLDAGAIFAADMLPETAYVKLLWALSCTTDVGKVKELFLANLAGESNYISQSDDFQSAIENT